MTCATSLGLTWEQPVRPVAGFPDYWVTVDGRVLSTKLGEPTEVYQEWSHKGVRRKAGHLRVALYHNGRRHRRYVHFLVAAAYLGPRPKGHETCHRDGDRTNNSVWNLYYGTRRENALDRERHKREAYEPDPELGF